MKTLYWILGIFLVCLGFLFIFSGSGATISPALQLNQINPHDHVEGNASSSVIVIEYADFQCPACRSYYPVMKQEAAEFGTKVAFVYRYFPLTSIHPNAEFGAIAAEAAGLQGKFWQMHDLLYEKQDEWASKGDVLPLFDSYAELAGLDVKQFDLDFKSKAVRNTVNAYRNYALKIGLQGTPTFYIAGKKVENPASPEAFKLLIQQALENNKPVSYKDLIQVDAPVASSSVSSPVTVSGKARGSWYFEASFPVQVLDSDGTVLGSIPAQAQGEWMTTNYVPFTASVTFTKPKGKIGSIIFKKDNPSGDPTKEDSVSIPVSF